MFSTTQKSTCTSKVYIPFNACCELEDQNHQQNILSHRLSSSMNDKCFLEHDYAIGIAPIKHDDDDDTCDKCDTSKKRLWKCTYCKQKFTGCYCDSYAHYAVCPNTPSN